LRAFVLALAAVLPPSAAGAHDFWIEPSTFAPVVAQRVDVGLCEGDGFDCRALPRDDGRIEKFVAVGDGKESSIPGLHGYEPAGLVRFKTNGPHTLVYRSHRSFTRLEAWRFEQHLAETGLARISALRRERGTSNTDAREAFSRYAKALLSVGERGFEPEDAPLGLKLELVAETDRAFRLLFEGKPIEGVLVSATRRDTTGERLEARTDAGGRVTFALRSGTWLIAAVHMTEASRGVDADWESFWASLTFQLSPQSTVHSPQPEDERL
jgi:hypothetical protein